MSDARIGVSCDRRLLGMLLDDVEAVAGPNDALDVRVRMARDDGEVRRIGPQALVLGAGQLAPFEAALAPTLAEELD